MKQTVSNLFEWKSAELSLPGHLFVSFSITHKQESCFFFLQPFFPSTVSQGNRICIHISIKWLCLFGPRAGEKKITPAVPQSTVLPHVLIHHIILVTSSVACTRPTTARLVESVGHLEFLGVLDTLRSLWYDLDFEREWEWSRFFGVSREELPLGVRDRDRVTLRLKKNAA